MFEGFEGFHPAVATWFRRRFPDGPTEPQQGAWPSIARRDHTLVAAPTGSGKTLAAFLVCIDQLYRAAARGEPLDDTAQVLYVSPLKALAVDIQQNLETPLREIRAIAEELGLAAPEIRVGVRSGDTSPSDRAAMVRRPPHFVITTPESLYLLVTAERTREMLRSVTTVIVDEIHAVARDKRGSHLALTLERLEHVCHTSPVRIGLSATQRPIETVARLLVGAGPDRDDADGNPRCTVINTGHQRHLDIAIELPDGELEAVASAEQMGEILDHIAKLVVDHRTTLVFVNTRRMAERVAHLLSERLGDDKVSAHHGSLSKERRLRVETRLRAGDLRALVATASLELGIDIGPVELACQIGSPRSIATFLQRVGRSGHSRTGTPKGRLYPTSRDELVECAALLKGIRDGRLDALLPPVAPLDILAQQIVAECAAEEWDEKALYALARRASPFASLSADDYDDVVELVSEGIQTGRGRRAAYVHRDAVNGKLRGRRGARLAALTSGGAIPEVGDYRVVAEPDDTFVGTVNEDWAIESMAGDIFLLGTTSWRIRRIEPGKVRVADAAGLPPTIPFWLGEAPSRTAELSDEVSALRAEVDRLLLADEPEEARRWLARACGLGDDAATMIVNYLGAGRTALGVMPTGDELVLERFFDDTGGMQLVVHAPLGGRINRGLGLALRKRFCKTFDFELQAAASDDAVVLSLGPQHSFPLADVPKFLSSNTVEEVLSQAVLASPMFTARWRWNLNRALAVLRFRGGRRNPPPIQRMEADDLMAAVFPSLAACQENVSGPIEIPDHVLVRQTMYDCLHEAMDVDGLRELVAGIETGAVTVHLRDTTEASPLSHEILNGRPFTFLDDAPLEERRTRSVQLRRGLPVDARDLGRLDPDAIERVRAEAAPDLRNPDELHDLLLSVVVLQPVPEWEDWFDDLVAAGRAGILELRGQAMWCATESRTLMASEPDAAAVAIVRGHLEITGPVTSAILAERAALTAGDAEIALAQLESEGFAVRGSFDRDAGEQWCARRLLARIHSYTQRRLRREIEPVTPQDFMRFLLRWQHVAPGTQREGRRGVLAVVEQLQGFEVPAAAWEESVLPTRIDGYRREWLDDLCLSGEVAWARLGLVPDGAGSERGSNGSGPNGSGPNGGRRSPSRATPLSFLIRADQGWLLQAARGGAGPAIPTEGVAAEVLAALRTGGAQFHGDLVAAVGRLPVEVEEGLWEAVARGLVTADGFHAIRSLFSARTRWERRQSPRRRGLRRGAGIRAGAEGRWTLVPPVTPVDDADLLAEAVAEQLLARWGVVVRDLLVRETLAVPWRELLWAFRRLEARGTIRGGRFVNGFVGEQYALPAAVEQLRAVRKAARTGETVHLSGADPLNLVGVLTSGARVPAVRTNRVTYVDGLADLPTADLSPASPPPT